MALSNPAHRALIEGQQHRRHPERNAQESVIECCRRFEAHYPFLHWVHASLNGIPLPPRMAHKASAAGMVAGIWDLFSPIRGVDGSSGLYIEMKAGTALSAHQKAFRDLVVGQGFRCVVCHDWTVAMYTICEHLGIDDPTITSVLRMNTKGVV